MSAAAALLLTALAVPAGPERLAILPAVVEGPAGEASARAVFDAVAEGVGIRLGLDVIGYDELFLQGATSRATEAARCGSDQACVARILQDVGADSGLRAIVNFALEPPLVTVAVVAADGRRTRSPTLAEAGPRAPWDQVFVEATRATLDELGFVPAGRLEVTTEPAGAPVTVDGAPPDASGGWRLRPGRHVVRGEGPGGKAEVEAVVLAHRTTQVALPLPTARVTDSGGVLASPWFWAGVGVVVLGAATAAVVAADPFARDPAPGCFCVTTQGGPCTPCP